MIRGLRTIKYPTPDLAKGKAWYSQVLELEPYFDEPFYVGYNVGGFELGLVPDDTPGADGAVAYWGVDDCAAALVHLMKSYSGDSHVNVGAGDDVTILELTQTVADVVGYNGKIERDLTKPDGTPRKLMSGEKIRALGWRPRIALREGLADAYRAFLETAASAATRPPA